jgi:hypothetical protein
MHVILFHVRKFMYSRASLCRSGAYVATRAAARAPMRGLAQPSAEVVSACLSPRVWVRSFWFGFALRRVAMLCGVFVRLHLPLFPAGGAFSSVSLCNFILTSNEDPSGCEEPV